MSQTDTALVVEAQPPIDNVLKTGSLTHSDVRILVGEGSDGRLLLGSHHRRDPEHWIVPGEQVPVAIDSANPQGFEVAWDLIPSMPERVAAREPALVDPIAARNNMNEALIAATSAVQLSELPPDLATAVSKAQSASADQNPIEALLSQADGASAQDGRQRAVVVIATQVVKIVSEGMGDQAERNRPTREGKHDAVLAVYVPGQQPYAVYVEKLKHPRHSGVAGIGGIPATISPTDPNDIDLDWKGAKEAGVARVNQRLDDAKDQMERAMSGEPMTGEMGELEESMQKAQQEAIAKGPPAGMGAEGGASQISPQMRQMMIQNAKVALANCPPGMREMMIQQYRMAGIEIDEQGNVLE